MAILHLEFDLVGVNFGSWRLRGLGYHVIDILRHIPRIMLLNVDIGTIKVLLLFVTDIHIVLVDLIQ